MERFKKIYEQGFVEVMEIWVCLLYTSRCV